MNSLSVRILAAVITFTLGVAIASLWLAESAPKPIIDPLPAQPPATRLEMVFVLDTTSSMTGLLGGAKQRIWGIVNDVMQESHSSVRIGLVAYRDHGDDYVTQVLPLTDDLDKVYTTLMDYKAEGGGDTPEDVRTALAQGLERSGWTASAPDVTQLIFLVGDAPPHDNYFDEVDTLTTAAKAVNEGIIVNTIQCGDAGDTTRAWKAIAQRGHGQYFAIPFNGGVQTIETPYDEELSRLSSELGGTFTAYGFGALRDAEERRAEVTRQAANLETHLNYAASDSAKAERAYNKVLNNKAYVGDLLQNIENGSMTLAGMNPDDLPEDLQKLSPAERQQEVERRLSKRRELRAKILELSQQRGEFLKTEQAKTGKADGFDGVVSKTVREQMRKH